MRGTIGPDERGAIKGTIKHGPWRAQAQLSGMPNYPGAELSRTHCTGSVYIFVCFIDTQMCLVGLVQQIKLSSY